MTQSSGRPTTFEDLDVYERSGVRLAAFSVPEFQDDPELVRTYAEFIHAALNVGHTVKDGEVTAYLSNEDKDAKLAAAQRAWDSHEQVYNAWVNDGVKPQYTYGVESWAKREGLPVPEAVSA